MKKRMVLLTILILFLGICDLCIKEALAETQETREILNRMEKKYADRDFSADFHQISTLTALEITETASGKAFFSHPGKMRWKYLVPTRHEIISDGNTLWIYRPDENQVVKGDAQAFFTAGAGGAFLSNISLVREQYSADIKEDPTDVDHITLTLKPRKLSSEIKSIHIRILKKNDHIVQVKTINPYGDETTLEFWNIAFKKIAPEVFDFNIPEGVDVIEMQ